jgi:hypothetical protein
MERDPSTSDNQHQGARQVSQRYKRKNVLVRVGSSVELEGIKIEQSDAALIRNYECVFE